MYEKPQLEVVKLPAEDVVRTSGPLNGGQPGDPDGGGFGPIVHPVD